MTLPPIVLVLGHIQIHISDSGDIAFYIKIPINETFSLTTTLNILYIYLDNEYI